MLSSIKIYLSSKIGFYIYGKAPSTKKKPPAHKRNKHLRKKKPGVFSGIWDFISARVGWKGFVLASSLLSFIIFAVCQVAYTYSPVDPLSINDFEIEEPTWKRPPYELNNALQMARRLRTTQRVWPTAIESDNLDNLYVATSSGAILKISKNEKGLIGEGALDIIRQGAVPNVTLPMELFHFYTGKPMGLRYTEGTDLLFVLDQAYGLYIVSATSKISSSLLPISLNETGMKAPTAFAVSHHGTDVYITEFSDKWSDFYFMNQILEGNCTGRLLKYDFGTKDLQVLLNDLCAPVGIEITPNDTNLLIAEAQKPRIRTVQLNTMETLQYTKLPGFPGRLTKNPRGGCWMPITVINKGFFEMVNPRKWLRKLLGGLLPPHYLKSLATVRHTILAEVDPNGNVVDSLHDGREEKVYEVAEAKEGRRGQLIIASPEIEHIVKLVSEENKDETKTPVKQDEEEDEFARMLRKEQEEMAKEFVFDPEPDGNVNEKLIGEEFVTLKDSPRDISMGWYDKEEPVNEGVETEKGRKTTEKKEL